MPTRAAALVLGFALLGCSSPDTSAVTSAGGPAPAGGPSFHEDVEPILQQSCQGCHRDGGIAPFALLTYDDAKAVAQLMVDQTRTGKMPPWGALETDACKPKHGWKEDLRLTEAQIATFDAWRAAGTPEGDPAAAPPAVAPVDGLSGVDLELQADAPFVTSGAADQFRCFVLDPKITARTYMNGLHVVPGNPKVVHHVVVFADPAAESATKPLGPDGGYDCFSGADLAKQDTIGAWAPGGVPTELPPNIGTPLDPGTLIVMQIHYHPAGATADPDLTKLQLRFGTEVPQYFLTTRLFGNDKVLLPSGDGLQPQADDGAGGPEFLIPAGAADHVEEMQITLPPKLSGKPMPKLWIYGAASHMHLVGSGERTTLEHADPALGTECLLETPEWDFSWQRFYAYDAAVEELPVFVPGDKLHLRCAYDNTLENAQLGKALADQGMKTPIDVTLGESTLQEMCIVALPILYEAPVP